MSQTFHEESLDTFVELHLDIVYQREAMESRFFEALDELEFGYDVDEETGCWNARQTYQRGYGWIRICGKQAPLHRWVWSLFYDEIPAGLCVLHRCDNPACFRPSHLFLGTHGANVRDMLMKGRARGGPPSGAQHPRGMAKLDEAKVSEILNLHASGMAQHLIAKQFGITSTTVSDITKRGAWAHVPRPSQGSHS